MQRFLIICGICSFAVLYFLTSATDSNSPLSPYFWVIVLTAGALALCLAAIVLRYILYVMRDKRNRILGSQIARRLAVMFTLIALLPALFLLGVSARFISHSIDSWFGDDTREALERSLQLSKTALEHIAEQNLNEARIFASGVHLERDAAKIFQRASEYQPLAYWAEWNGVYVYGRADKENVFDYWLLWDVERGAAVKEHNPGRLGGPEWDKADTAEWHQAGGKAFTESLNGSLYSSGWLMLPESGGLALFFRQPVPERVARDAVLIESARSKYAELSFAQKGLQTFFLITLLIAAVLAMLLALAAALHFARRFVEPILLLAQGARSVAQGDFSGRIPIVRRDELGQLAGLFNHMNEQLAIAKQSDERHRTEQEAARHYLQRVLESLSAGVVTLDASGCLNTFNPAAQDILGVDLTSLIGANHREWATFSVQHAALSEYFSVLTAAQGDEKPVEADYPYREGKRILLGKAVRLPEENGSGLVLVFDNITTLVQAQKAAAWGEVAKRLAHEIRNPLTPIQLSAERLALKLQDQLDSKHLNILNKSTDTIIKQVAALKEMVEAFRDYARAPSLKFEEIDLNALVEEVLLLYESGTCAFHAELDTMQMLLKADTTAMRQVLHNLFKNAAEAAESDENPKVCVRTRGEDGKIVLTVSNNGKPFSNDMLQNAFEPYVTDKPSGTGLGLPVVKKIAEEHNGCIKLENTVNGAQVTIILPRAA